MRLIGNEQMRDHNPDQMLAAEAQLVVPVELWEVNEQLLLAGLREHALATELERQLAFTSAIAGSLAEGVCAVDRAGQITFANAAAERLLGWREAELLGRAADTVLQSPVAASSNEPFPIVDVLHSGATYHNDHAIFIRKDGTVFPVVYSVAPIVAAEQIVGTVVAFDDVTEVQRLQQMQEEYLALLSHDLRTPLTAMLGYTQLLLRQLDENALERARRSANAIVRSGASMERLLQDVLDRSRLRVGRAELHLAAIDLAQLVTRAIDQNLLPGERARIKVEAVGSLAVVADPTRMERVIVNLLTNACKYSAPTDPVVVQLFRMGNDAVISVTDQGVGIDADDLPSVFEKHFRATTAGTIEGIGLGLYGSRLIVEAHGGRIWAQSTVGTGSTFVVSIPAAEPGSSE